MIYLIGTGNLKMSAKTRNRVSADYIVRSLGMVEVGFIEYWKYKILK